MNRRIEKGERFQRFLSASNVVGKYKRVEAEQPREDVIWHYAVTIQHHFVETSACVSTSWWSSEGETKQKTVMLASLADPALVLSQALPITLYVSANQVAAYSYDLDELAIGEDEASALGQMRETIAESYRLLKSERNNLGALQQVHWKTLRALIREV